MRITMIDHEVASSGRDSIEIDGNRVFINHAGEVYVISQRPDGVLQIEAPRGELRIDSASIDSLNVVAHRTCLTCAKRMMHKKNETPCGAHRAERPAPTPPIRSGPRIVESPPPKRVKCEDCRSTIEYEPEDLFRAPSLPSSDDVGPMAVKCPKPGCGGRGYPR
jgi:hypothetical protein